MKISSPLRYPGGKSSMSGLLSQIRKLNNLGNRAVAEPYAGGAGAALSLLFLEDTPKIFINDADPAIHDFWWSLVNEPESFTDRLSRTRVTMAEWRRQRDVYKKSKVKRIDRGFAAFFLNRCNRSGIIMNGGPIGGITQSGPWKISARFNKATLKERCNKIAEYSDRITVSGQDGVEFINTLTASTTFYFIDPPYFHKGPSLYLNSIDPEYHNDLAENLKERQDAAWVLTYDDCPEIRRMYSGWAKIKKFKLKYSAATRRSGTEILITPKWMKLPLRQYSDAITW